MKKNWISIAIIVIALGGLWVKAYFARNTATTLEGWAHAESQLAPADAAKPTLVLFTADWCGPCQSFKHDVLTQSDVAQELKQSFNLIKVDLTDSQAPGQKIAEQFNVEGIPTLVLLSPGQQEAARAVGSMSKSGFLDWLHQSAKKPT
ncbi:MAG: thioredoxin fold domain-containing protein [Phycisphaeraceae bacterium]|nr:thioredoxin fold domain-containing protein [Phycisphaeraceae bacterium]